MPLARTIIIFGKNNRFKKIFFNDDKKAQRQYEKLKRKGLDVQYLY